MILGAEIGATGTFIAGIGALLAACFGGLATISANRKTRAENRAVSEIAEGRDKIEATKAAFDGLVETVGILRGEVKRLGIQNQETANLARRCQEREIEYIAAASVRNEEINQLKIQVARLLEGEPQ